ncbi:MAG: protein-L-isoaspartate(D-aspartate) O-methyltransferase [Candidatus Abyssobacteria bacterium SURF_17]|jgi:protein-L-isoaspartate(D-aspartate) O-methyltransferase|uniref:Protein-L-isoaspartate O-methyltransferase n=1 Tax=Candidatus Abyssobacteria bacterium SURF_17 TaxID=2093361 RepID=A0A419EXJ3_9BACT|nr:MAG: protein-L-isoaspartate(D-aspartate) O-methyltransferase [Candidatus Abyssubacteria bacterium SURF_17]
MIFGRGANSVQFEEARRRMVERQLRARGITDERVLASMLLVPRHEFVPEELRDQAYEDHPLAIGENQTISQPYMVAVMTQELQLKPSDVVLEIGTGSGYQAAVLSRLASAVYTIERHQSLAFIAHTTLREVGYRNVIVICSDGSGGLPDKAPFDGIIVTAGAPEIPHALLDQLGEGGRLVIPVGEKMLQVCKRITKHGGRFETQDVTGCVFVPLIGKFGWEI